MLRIIKNYLKFVVVVSAFVYASIFVAWAAGMSADTYITHLSESIVWVSTTIIDAVLTLVKAAYIIIGSSLVVYMWLKLRTEYNSLKETIKNHKAKKIKGEL
ncbi:hypothetical protein [Pseudomonas savastanoi]|uniref:Uncharacterized protein n=2 Tax=Pseudomonas savastanoi pv. glycinea TaxID=318 RepID=A0A0P9TIU6_PSESG|nr:hypothetical protein [Pseudomonas savastanoi]EFW77222.1 hypothetical protein PsgB076_29625 [Pseudomonas savastanoi pv. glycinea str. B076]EFW82810.1 hypothetical protein PsgRace4_27895 [Pseudomonas savastanoi pv. glycinea str. race 4]EGH16749.1 hypothetical protein Pgy4_27315 [Pseudomonas savastanoi pv. glycinea str. race 4]KPX40540.1 hypothetical protein ALO37_102389 [Pseudomonas savastanoi pv. glycinea]MCQ3008318.1 hypothetical protein [Pseudomonas savastanoi]